MGRDIELTLVLLLRCKGQRIVIWIIGKVEGQRIFLFHFVKCLRSIELSLVLWVRVKEHKIVIDLIGKEIRAIELSMVLLVSC